MLAAAPNSCAIRRTVAEYDNTLFSAITHNLAPLHLDEEYSKTTMYGARIINSMFTLALVVGLSVGDTTLGTTVGNLGFEKIDFPSPVFVGDTITVETTVLEARRSKSRPGLRPAPVRRHPAVRDVGCR